MTTSSAKLELIIEKLAVKFGFNKNDALVYLKNDKLLPNKLKKELEKKELENSKNEKLTKKQLENKEKEKQIDDSKNEKLTKKQQAIDKLFKPNEEGVSEWISKYEIDKNDELKWGNNGISRHGLFHKDDRFNWEFKRKNDTKSGKIEAIRTNGINIFSKIFGKNTPTRDDIHDYHKSPDSCCVVCGSKSDLRTDHKNDLYNDPRVLDTKTQTKEDFQCLCNHCNLQKRQILKKTMETGKRYGATNIPSLSVFGIDFIEGDETFDKNNVDAMVGTYWYDPVKFMDYLKKTL